MHNPTAARSAPRAQLLIFVFLFTVFGMSSWEFHNAAIGFDAADAATISDQARIGSQARQIALAALGGFSALLLVKRTRYRVTLNGLLGAGFLFYICWVVLSITWSIDTGLTLKAVVRFILMCAGALAIAKTMSIRQIAVLTFYMCLLTLIVSVVYEYHLGTFAPLDDAWRLSGALHPVAQGWNCSLLCLSALYISHDAERGAKTWVCIFIVSLAFLLLTKSRMTFGATLAGIGTYWVIVLRRPQKVTLVLATVICLCLMYFVAGDHIGSYSLDIASFGRGKDGAESIGTLTGRIPLWEECLASARRRPYCGFGYNTFLSPRFLLNIRGAAGWTSSPHSGYIGTLVELGVIGIVVLLLTIGAAIRASLRNSAGEGEHVFSVCILVWLTMNLFLESFLITSSFFSTFLVLVIIEKLAFTTRATSEHIPV